MIEMTLVGMYADRSPACVSMIGSAVSEPPPSCVVQLRRALQQARVQVEDVARDTPRGPADAAAAARFRDSACACFDRSS